MLLSEFGDFLPVSNREAVTAKHPFGTPIFLHHHLTKDASFPKLRHPIQKSLKQKQSYRTSANFRK
jgi:hypothetical protein